MQGLVYLAVGTILMLIGATSVQWWINGQGGWIDNSVLDRPRNPVINAIQFCLFLLSFMATVIVPLLSGAMLIVYSIAVYHLFSS